MLLLISPAKKLDMTAPLATANVSQPRFLEPAQKLVNQLKTLAPHQLSALLHISDSLGELNHDRFNAWQQPFTTANARTALHAFKGDVYVGLDAPAFSDNDMAFAQQHLRILSGLYGVLRPLDLMQAYRLEMGTRLTTANGSTLYDFWGDTITDCLNKDLTASGGDTVVNLASGEYFKAVNTSRLQGRLLTPQFKDLKNGQYKVISFYAKKARGLMAAYAIRQRLTNADKLKNFAAAGYAFNADLSSTDNWVFTRNTAA